MREIKEINIINNFLSKKAYKDKIPDSLNRYVKLFVYNDKEIILHQGDDVKELFLIMNGKCAISWNNNNGNLRTLYTLNAPCFIGESEMLNEGFSLQVSAVGEVILLSLPFEKCLNVLLKDNRFLLALSKEISKKGRVVSLSLINDFAYPLENRLAKLIIENSDEMIFKMKKVDISRLLGVSYRHLEFVMKKFVDKGYLSKNRLVYTIIDYAKLKSLAKPLDN